MALVEISHLDTVHFGMRTARASDVTTDSLPRILDFCRNDRVALLIARCDASNLPAARAMSAAGFEMMDTLLYAERSMAVPLGSSDPSTLVRPARPEDVSAIEAIARQCFRGYQGHYHADPRLDRAKCDEAYVDWARRGCAGDAADVTFVGEVDGALAGFASVRGGETGTLPLGGVARDARGRGIYRALVEESVRWCMAAGSKRMVISSQINSPTVTTWIRVGFRLCGAAHTFHKWFDPGPATEDRR